MSISQMIAKYRNWIVLCVFIYLFGNTILALSDIPEIEGHRVYGYIKSHEWTNGFSYYEYHLPVWEFDAEDASPWKECTKLHERIESLLKIIYQDWEGQNSYLYVSRKEKENYHALLKFDGRLIHISGFADFGGGLPTDAEKEVCSKSP